MGRTQIIATQSISGAPSPPAERFCDWLPQFVYRHRKLFFIGLVVMYLLAFNGQWQLEPDSALYLELGKNISRGRGFEFHNEPQALAYPGLPYALSAFYRIAPAHVYLLADMFILACGLIAIACVFRMVRLAYDKPTACVVTLGFGICYELFRYCFEIMTDVPFLMGVTAFLAGYQGVFGNKITVESSLARTCDGNTSDSNTDHQRTWIDWFLMIAGFGVCASTRPTMLGLAAAWVGAMIITSIFCPKMRRALLITIAGAIVAIGIALLLETHRSHRPLDTYEKYAFYVLTHNLHDQLHYQVPANLRDLFYNTAARAVVGVPLDFDWISALFASIFLITGILLARRQILWALWVIVTIFMLTLFVSHDRYILEILPILVLGWWRLMVWLNRKLPAGIGNILFCLMLSFGSVPNMIKDLHVILTQRQLPFLRYYKNGRYPPYIRLADAIHTHAGPNDVVLSPLKVGRILTLLSDRNVYEPPQYSSKGNGQNVWVVFDPADDSFTSWLESKHIALAQPPIAKYDRTEVNSPVMLMEGEVK